MRIFLAAIDLKLAFDHELSKEQVTTKFDNLNKMLENAEEGLVFWEALRMQSTMRAYLWRWWSALRSISHWLTRVHTNFYSAGPISLKTRPLWIKAKFNSHILRIHNADWVQMCFLPCPRCRRGPSKPITVPALNLGRGTQRQARIYSILLMKLSKVAAVITSGRTLQSYA